MALKVFGTGFGRTGTNSLKLALEHLGFGPCHHMYEIRDDPGQLHFWQKAAAGELPDWDAAFAGYSSSVDWPSVFFWREITAHYPDAKVIHSHRPEDAWLRSIHATIHPTMRDRDSIEPGNRRNLVEMCQKLIGDQTFGGRLGEADHALSVYRAHDAAIRAAFSPERMLVLDVAEGWTPLCAFLGVAVPDVPFPFVNRSQEFIDGQAEASKRE
jgi:hypothetical protein